MPQFLVAIHHPVGFDAAAAADAEQAARDITALNGEMKAAGVRVFVGGLQPAGRAKAVRRAPDGRLSVTDGPYIEAKEHVGGFWVLEVADLDAALGWAQKATIACRTSAEVRQFN